MTTTAHTPAPRTTGESAPGRGTDLALQRVFVHHVETLAEEFAELPLTDVVRVVVRCGQDVGLDDLPRLCARAHDELADERRRRAEHIDRPFAQP